MDTQGTRPGPVRRGAAATRANAEQVVRYDRDPGTPGRPLHLLIPGGIVAVVAFLLAILVVYRTYWTQVLPERTAAVLLVILGLLYVGGVFLFSYGYRLYDVRRALLLTAVLVFLGVAIVALLAVVLIALRDADIDLPGGGSSDDSTRWVADLGSGGGGGGGGGSRGGGDTLNATGTCPSCGFPGYPHNQAPCVRCGWPRPPASPGL